MTSNPTTQPEDLGWDGGDHRIRFTTPHARAALEALNDAADSGLELAQLGLKPVGERFEAWLAVARASAGAAERLADRLAARAGVEGVRLEHLKACG